MRPLFAALLLACVVSAHGARLEAPNVVPITEKLVTSGQPSAAALATLRADEFDTVIYLAPPTVSDAVKEEPEILQRQGLAYLNIPIRFNHPTPEDFERFAAALKEHEGRKVLVHCQINLRASSMVFLHRVIVGQEPADKAYQSVTRVWVPDRVWKAYIVAMLRRHGSDFEPY